MVLTVCVSGVKVVSGAGSDSNSRPVFRSSSDTQLASVTALWARQTQGTADRSLTQENTHPRHGKRQSEDKHFIHTHINKHRVLHVAHYGRTRLEDILK